MRRRIEAEVGVLQPVHGPTGNGPARYYRLAGARGTLGFIGALSDHEDQPLIIASHLGVYAIVTVGKVLNAEALARKAFDTRAVHFAELGANEINQTELVAMLVNQGETFADGIRRAQDIIEGSCSLLILTRDGIYAARDRLGRTPVIIGAKPDARAATLETCAFPNLGYEVERILGPGEVVRLTPDAVEPVHPPGERLRICAFLWVYYGFPTSAYEGINVEEVRFRNGVRMGREDETEVDSVCSIPDSGTGMAMGYAVGKGVPYRQAVAKYTPTWPRSFMPTDKERRALVARMKLLPNADVMRDARLVCCDDSIVRGTQLKNNVDVFYRHGVKEIHVRISCPPLIYKCPYLNFTTTRTDMELITRRYIHAQPSGTTTEGNKHLCRYIDHTTPEYKAMVESICREMNFTSLKYNTINNLIASIGLPREHLCTYCFEGSGCGE